MNDKSFRPAVANKVENMHEYTHVFVGFPIWWGDMPMAVYTYLESHDFSGKTIIPFCTHEGSGLSGTVESIAVLCPDAAVLGGLAIRGHTAQESQDEAGSSVKEWIDGLNF